MSGSFPPPNMPSADFCTAVRGPLRAPQSRWTRCRSPGVSLTAFTAHLPNLQPGLVVDTGLRGSGPARPTPTASYSVPVRQVAALLPRFLQTAPRGHRPCASLALCLHQTWAEDLHLRAVKHARHTRSPQPVSFLLITPLKNPEAVPTLRHASRLLHFRVTVNTKYHSAWDWPCSATSRYQATASAKFCGTPRPWWYMRPSLCSAST